MSSGLFRRRKAVWWQQLGLLTLSHRRDLKKTTRKKKKNMGEPPKDIPKVMDLRVRTSWNSSMFFLVRAICCLPLSTGDVFCDVFCCFYFLNACLLWGCFPWIAKSATWNDWPCIQHDGVSDSRHFETTVTWLVLVRPWHCSTRGREN